MQILISELWSRSTSHSKHAMQMSYRLRESSQQAGLTLLELLIAIALFAAVGMVATLMLNQAIKNSAILENRNAELISLMTGLNMVEQDLSQINRRSYKKKDNALGIIKLQPMTIIDQPDQKYMQFVKSGGVTKQILPQLVRYHFYDNKLVRGVNKVVDGHSDSAWSDSTLITGISETKMSYFIDNQWNDTFININPTNGLVFPRAIRITFRHNVFGQIEKIVLLPDERL